MAQFRGEKMKFHFPTKELFSKLIAKKLHNIEEK